MRAALAPFRIARLIGASAIGVCAIAACAADEPSTSSISPPAPSSTASGDAGSRPAFVADLDAGDASDASDARQAATNPPDPAFHARLLQQIEGVVRADYPKYGWSALLSASVPFSGVKIWIPGTGERLADDPTKGRAMGAVPSGLAAGGAALAYVSGGGLPSGSWVGIPCSQSEGGARFAALDRLSALEVFDTAWTDARAIVAILGPLLHGAWIVGHSAGANPAMLVGLLVGAHRVDIYGVPSAVGPLDGDDGLVHLHTHPLDPAGTMGKLGTNGSAQIDLLSAFVTTIKAGGTMSFHDYATAPSPSP